MIWFVNNDDAFLLWMISPWKAGAILTPIQVYAVCVT